MADKKIIIDEDWKTQVQAEKEAAAKKKEAEASQPSTPAQPEPQAAAPAAEPQRSARRQQIPEPSLALLFNTFATQAMIAMGEIPNPVTNKVDVRLEEARHFIDTLGVLEKKTEGNRTPQESAMLREILYQLRLAFVEAQNRTSAPAKPGK